MAETMTLDELLDLVTDCSAEEKQATRRLICKDPRALQALTLACGREGAKLATGLGLAGLGVALAVESGAATVVSGGTATPVTGWGIAAGVATTAAGLTIAKDARVRKFCGAAAGQAKRVLQSKAQELFVDRNPLTVFERELGMSDDNDTSK